MRNRCKLKTIVKVVGIIFAIAAFSNLSFTVNLSNNNGNNRKIVKEDVETEIKQSSYDWDPPLSISVGDIPNSVFIEDANNDGYNDIVTANTRGSDISIVLWNATSSNWDTEIRRSVNTRPYCAFVGDANNDGYNDIVTANYEVDTISIFLWNATSNNWGDEILKNAHNTRTVFVGDANNDGQNEIIAADNQLDETFIFFWNSTSNDWDAPLQLPVGDGPHQALVGDADNDGFNDIITVDFWGQTVSILSWNASISYWNPVDLRSTASYCQAVSLGDVNNDGYNDIVAANRDIQNISIFLWNATINDWNDQFQKTVGRDPYSVFIGDTNNDGFNDIVTANRWYDRIGILLWNSTSGTWNDLILKSVGYDPSSVFIGDANNDGLNDIVSANNNANTVSVFLLQYIDDEPPIINIIKPFQNEIFGLEAPEFNVEIFEPNIDTMWYTIDEDITNTTFYSNGTIDQMLWDYFGNVSIKIIFYANDTNGRMGSAEVTIKKNIYNPPTNILNVEINEQSFSTKEYNITFYISNQAEQAIDFASLQLWWNGTDVSSDVQNLGNGFYFVSLTPLFVLTGEAPLLLNMTISALGYEDKYFETYIAVESSGIVKMLQVEITHHSYSLEHFNFTFFIFNETGQGIDSAGIQILWNGTDVSTDILNIGAGFYFVSLEPITVAHGEDPILLNMTISASGYENKNFETNISVEPCEIAKMLQVEITDHSYSLEHFNFTFFVFNETDQGIDFASLQLWWNGTDVSSDVQNLGNGFYFVSLESITVAPGEDPILLDMVISAFGYEDKLFETYLTVDPDTLEKVGKPPEEFPLTIFIIATISTVAGIGITSVAIYLLRKRK